MAAAHHPQQTSGTSRKPDGSAASLSTPGCCHLGNTLALNGVSIISPLSHYPGVSATDRGRPPRSGRGEPAGHRLRRLGCAVEACPKAMAVQIVPGSSTDPNAGARAPGPHIAGHSAGFWQGIRMTRTPSNSRCAAGAKTRVATPPSRQAPFIEATAFSAYTTDVPKGDRMERRMQPNGYSWRGKLRRTCSEDVPSTGAEAREQRRATSMPIVWLGLGLSLVASFALVLWMKVGISTPPHSSVVVVRAVAGVPAK